MKDGKILEMQRKPLKKVVLWFLVPAIAVSAAGLAGMPGSCAWIGMAPAKAEAAANPDDEEIQWFRDQLGIADQYRQEHDGIWGMSWAHLLTMVFLVLFAVGALYVFVQRQRRTREILEIIQKEMKDGNTG